MIKELNKTNYKGKKYVFKYKSNSYYDVELSNNNFSINLVKRNFNETIDKQFTSTLFEDFLESPSLYGIVEDELVAFIEISRESWNKRIRVSNILVQESVRGKGYGTLLMNHVKELLKKENFRAIVLETQSCNYPAIQFYLKNGFKLTGCDLTAYNNNDIERKEVRLEFVYID